MARPRTGGRRLYPKPTMTYLSPSQRRALEAAAERAEMTLSTFLRRIVAAELGRLAVRERLTQA